MVTKRNVLIEKFAHVARHHMIMRSMSIFESPSRSYAHPELARALRDIGRKP
jgi:hypothetical protein